MSDNPKNINSNSIVQISHDSTFLSISIILISAFSMFVQMNNANIETLNICDVSFLCLVMALCLSGIDIIVSFREYKHDKIATAAKVFSWIVVGLAGVVILSAVAIWGRLLRVDDLRVVGFNGNLEFLHTQLRISRWTNECYLWYFGSAIFFQLFANICKLSLKKREKNRLKNLK